MSVAVEARGVSDTHGGVSKIERYGWKILDEPGEFAMLPKHMLFVDHSYQRELNKARALEMAHAWSHVACGCIAVSLREQDTLYAVVDGQHRVDAAMRRSDITELPCLIFDFSTISEEAKAFILLNSMRKPMSWAAKWNALRMSGDSAALVLDELANQAGRTISSASEPTTIGCISKLLSYARDEERLLRKVWPLVFGVCKGEVLNAKVLDGIMRIERGLPAGVSLTQARWSKRLHQIGYDGLLSAIDRAVAFRGIRSPLVCAEGIEAVINRGLRSDKLPLIHEPVVVEE